MAIRQRVSLKDRALTTRDTWEINKKDGKFLRVVTINTAYYWLDRMQKRGHFPRDKNQFTTWVDRDPRKQEVQVKQGGKIQYIRKQQLSEIYNWIWKELHARSPWTKKKGTGRAPFRRRHYRQSHIVMADRRTVINLGEGRAGATLDHMSKRLANAKEVMFVNLQPYAKRIEHGSLSNKKMLGSGSKRAGKFKGGPSRGRQKAYIKLYWSPQAKRGVYQIVARAAAREFRGVARVDYRRVQIPQTGYKFTHEGQRIDQFYPAIRVRPDRAAQ